MQHECPNCGYSMSDNEERCKYCGSSNPEYKAPKVSLFSSAPSSTSNVPANNQTTTKKFSALLFIVLLIFFWPAAIIYLILYALMKNQ